MTINTTDIKLLESERMSDASDGGGRRTSNVIEDGDPGNIFPKVSRLDSVYGRVNLRKIYGAVVTPNLDTYAGAHAIITDPPDNDKIHGALFSTGSDFDTRTAARDRIESYVVAGPESRMILFGRQLVGQQAVLVYQRLEEPLPEVGEVYCLSKETAGVVNYQQFVRVTDMSHEVRTFTDGSGDFQRRVVSLQIGATLRYQFEGPETPSRQSGVTRSALVRSTTVADAARYYGIQKLAEAADEDALTVLVESVYTPIVPTTQRESPISLASIAGAGGFVVTSATDYADGLNSLGGVHYFRTGVKPGTVKVSKAGVLYSEDNSEGLMVATAAGGPLWNGTVDYQTGRVQVSANFISDFVTFAAKPAVEVSEPARTREIEITLGNRGTVYVETLLPLPNPGSVIVDYRALGKWYRLRDNGDGQISGDDAAYGVGTIDYVTGALVVTLGALPDVESSLLIAWGSPTDYDIRAGGTSDAAANLKQEFTLANLPVQPGSFALEFTSGVTQYTATANSSGVVSGNGVTGTVNHTTGAVSLTYTGRIPNPGSVVTASYNEQVPADPGNPINISGTFNPSTPPTLSPAPIVAGSFSTTVQVFLPASSYGSVSGSAVISDDGAGLLILRGGQQIGSVNEAPATISADTAVGTINYTTGATAITDLTFNVTFRRYNVTVDAPGWSNVTAEASISGPGAYVYTQSGGDPVQTAREEEFDTADAPLIVDLTATTGDQLVPNTVLFTVGTGVNLRRFFDRNGALYVDLNQVTGAATECGSINYSNGKALIETGYVQGLASYPIAVINGLTKRGDFSTEDAFFRTAGSPLRPASFYVQATALDGDLLSGTADANGVVTGTGVTGEVVQEMGVARIEFSKEIAPSTLRYSAVVLSNLPLNADILGLDPVRLPSDGRVPIFRPADVVVIHHTDDLALTNPVSAGATYSVGRTGLSQLWLEDADGDKVPTTKYTVNLSAGTVTMAADLDLTGYTQPLTAWHRIEEMQLLSDVQINGTLGLAAALSRDFPADSYVSSALLFGDMNARVTSFFDQSTWTSVWSDSLIGSGATAQYNDVDYPVEVLNESALTERWRINLTSSNPSSGTATFQVIGENLGVIATGNTGSDCAPINPLTGDPYFVLRAAGWGIGWSVGNQVRFNTIGATAPIWIARTVLPGATLEGDSLDLQMRGDVDA